MLRLTCAVQQYAWGKVAPEGMVARLKRLEGGHVVDGEAYAEFWMGTHPSGPSAVRETGQALADWLREHPAAAGDVSCGDGAGLPYLFKVLSIEKPLSVQAHPDKALAAQLHAARPDLYKDANHKPEMAYALTDLEAMCGFRPLREIRTHLEALPELRTVVTEAGTRGWRALGCGYASVALTVLRAAAMRFLEATDPMLELDEQQAARTHLPALFTAYMNCPGGVLREQVDALVDRLQVFGAHRTADSVMLRLAAEFPGDIGIFAPYLLNVIQLRQGQAIFLAANEPHAYLSGDIVECMACSDNVVRAGLTPKFKDKDTLCRMLSYACGVPSVSVGRKAGAHLTVFHPPVPEFQLERLQLHAGEEDELPAPRSAAIVLLLQGSAAWQAAGGTAGGADMPTGSAWVQPAGLSVRVRAAAGDELVLFRAQVNTSAAGAM